MAHRRELEREIALTVVRDDIARRLRRVCENFDEAEFAALVDRMAEIEVRYRLREEWMYGDMPSPRSFN